MCILWIQTHNFTYNLVKLYSQSQTQEYFNVDLMDQDGILKTLEIELNKLILFEFLL